MAAITPAQDKFLLGVLKGMSQREAYVKAFPHTSKWQPAAIDSRACALFRQDKMQQRYEQVRQRLAKEAEDEAIIDAKTVLKELGAIAFSDVTEYAKIVTTKRDDGSPGMQVVLLKDTHNLTKRQTSAIKKIKQGMYGIEIELYPKDKSLELLGKYLGMFTEKVELSGSVNNPFSEFTTEELKRILLSDE